MTKADFDITFCTSSVSGECGNIKDCPVRDNCQRNWTLQHSCEAKRLGLLEHKVYILVDPDMITDTGCENFLEIKK